MTEQIRSALANFQSQIQIRLAEKGRGYNVLGDPDIDPSDQFYRVSSILKNKREEELDRWMNREKNKYIHKESATLLSKEFSKLLRDKKPKDQWDESIGNIMKYIVDNSDNASFMATGPSREFGNDTHALLQRLSWEFDPEKQTPIPERFASIYNDWFDFLFVQNDCYEILATEQQLYCIDERTGIKFAGTVDAILIDQQAKSLVIIDYKTGIGFYPSHQAQLLGYSKALKYLGPRWGFLPNDYKVRCMELKLPRPFPEWFIKTKKQTPEFEVTGRSIEVVEEDERSGEEKVYYKEPEVFKVQAVNPKYVDADYNAFDIHLDLQAWSSSRDKWSKELRSD